MKGDTMERSIATSFELFKELPPEIIDTIFSQFCDGKSLSTLFMAMISDRRYYRSMACQTIPSITHRLLVEIATFLDMNKKNDFCMLYKGASKWISMIASSKEAMFEAGWDTPSYEETTENENVTYDNSKELAAKIRRLPKYRLLKGMRFLSENLAVIDFLRQSLSGSCEDVYEWPVWVGQISVEVSSSGTRVKSTARVMLTGPIQAPSHMPGSSLLGNRTPTALFRCEPMNLVPVPPWGKIKGLKDTDNRILKLISDQLEQAGDNHVAVPTLHQQYDPLDVRILTSVQARRRLASASIRPKTSRYFENSDCLVCCWHDDSIEDMDERCYITYMITLMNTLRRFEKDSINLA
jgi:hypothetical protein